MIIYTYILFVENVVRAAHLAWSRLSGSLSSPDRDVPRTCWHCITTKTTNTQHRRNASSFCFILQYSLQDKKSTLLVKEKKLHMPKNKKADVSNFFVYFPMVSVVPGSKYLPRRHF